MIYLLTPAALHVRISSTVCYLCLTTIHQALRGLAIIIFLGALQDHIICRHICCAQKLVTDKALLLYYGWKITKYLRDMWMSLFGNVNLNTNIKILLKVAMHIKRLTNSTIDCYGNPVCWWFLCMTYIMVCTSNSFFITLLILILVLLVHTIQWHTAHDINVQTNLYQLNSLVFISSNQFIVFKTNLYTIVICYIIFFK